MKKFWRLFMRVIFWSYERGSLPYDLMVIAILLFVLLTPRRWYHDQPNVGMRASAGQIQLLDMDPSTNTELFRIDASLLALPQQTRELEKETHEVLSRNVTSLHGQMFQIVQIQPVRDTEGRVTGYDVHIKPSRRSSQ